MPAENASYINFFASVNGVNEPAPMVLRSVNMGLALLLQLAEQNEQKRRAFLAIRAKNNLQGYVSDALGPVFTAQLNNHNVTNFTDPKFPGFHIELRLMTENNDVPNWQCPILAIHPTAALMTRIHQRHGVPDVIVVPWLQEEIAAWIEAQGPEAIELPPPPGANQENEPGAADGAGDNAGGGGNA